MIQEDDQAYESRVAIARSVIASHMAREFWRGVRWGAGVASAVALALVVLVAVLLR